MCFRSLDSVSFLDTEDGISAWFGASICFQLLLKLCVLFGPLWALQMAYSIPGSAEMLEVYWNLVHLKQYFFSFPTFLGEGRLIADIMTDFCWIFVFWLCLLNTMTKHHVSLATELAKTWRNHLNTLGLEIFSCTLLECMLINCILGKEKITWKSLLFLVEWK